MSGDPFAKTNYLGEPVILNRGNQLCALLTVCERAVLSLDDVADGKYRDKVTTSLASAMELAENIATELLVALERAQPARITRGDRNV